jgi:hypothetical protein
MVPPDEESVSIYQICRFSVAEFAGAETLDEDGDRPGNADGMGNLRFQPSCKPRGNFVLALAGGIGA